MITQRQYIVDKDGGKVAIYATTNVPVNVRCTADWVKHVSTRALEEKTIELDVAPNNSEFQRECEVELYSAEVGKREIKIIQKGNSDIYEKERNALIALYNSTGGDNWGDDNGTPVKDGWLSDAPVSTWNGIKTDELGRVIAIGRKMDNLTGELPDEIGDLEYLEIINMAGNHIRGSIPKTIRNCKNLREIYFGSNELSGSITKELFECAKLELIDLPMNDLSGSLPEEVGNLANLWCLSLRYNQLSGKLPESIGSLSNLECLIIDGNSFSGTLPDLKGCKSLVWAWMSGNNFSGTIPESYGLLPKLKDIELTWCGLSGDLPKSMVNNRDLWTTCWGNIVYGNNFNLDNIQIPAPTFTVRDMNGRIIDSSTLYKSNKLTMFFQWNQDCAVSNSVFPIVARLYNDCHDKGLEIIGLPLESDESFIRGVMESANTNFPNVIQGEGNLILPSYKCKNIYDANHSVGENFPIFYPTSAYPGITIFNSEGILVFSDVIDNPNLFESFVRSRLE